MPLGATLEFLALVIRRLLVQLVMLHRADGANFWIAAAEFSLGVQDRMNMQLGGLRLSGQFAESLNEFLLEIVGEVVLLPEEYHTPLRDWHVSELSFIRR